MKILMISDRLAVGGAETHIRELAEGLRARGETVELCSAGGETARMLEARGFLHHTLPFDRRGLLRLLSLRRRLRGLIRAGGYDVIHAHARLPAFLLRGMRIKGGRIVTAHARFCKGMLRRKAAYWGDRTIAVSEDLRLMLCREYHVPPEAITVIPNGVDPARFCPGERGRDGRLRVLFASRLDADCSKGADLLLALAPRLCRRYPHMEIGIVGGGSELARISERAREINRRMKRQCVKVLGTVERMEALLGEQDIFVGVSRAAMEAAACGCAVILCGNEGYLGILSQKNEEEARLSNLCCRNARQADALRLECDLRLLADRPAARGLLGERTREWICRALDADEMVEATLALYRHTVPAKNAPRLLVAGYFGCGNAGDDAILEGFLSATVGEASVTALTGRPRHDRRRLGIPCIGRRRMAAIFFEMRRCDAFLCGGGSLLQNASSRRSLCYYLMLLRMARWAGCRTLLYAAGIGPLYGTRAQARVARVLSACDYISLRDPVSYRTLSAMGIDRARLHEGADPALLLPPPPPTRATGLLREASIRYDERLLILVPRKLSKEGDAPLRALMIGARILCRRHACRPLVLCFCAEDAPVAESVRRTLGAVTVTPRETGDLFALIGRSVGVISMRLHALVLASASEIPSLGLSIDANDEKLPSFSRLVGQETLVRGASSVGEVVEGAERLFFSSDSKNKAILHTSVAGLRKKARKDLANILQMLYNGEDTESNGI